MATRHLLGELASAFSAASPDHPVEIVSMGGVEAAKLVAAADGKPASIDAGVSQRFVKGDVFIVPAGSPHWFSVVDQPVTYLEVRWLAPQ